MKIPRLFTKGLNSVLDKINEFEDRGGMRGAAERARVRGERTAQRVVEILEERGINVDFVRVPLNLDETKVLRRHYDTLGVPYDSEMAVVKAAFRAKMKIHHPDRHAHDAAAEKEATQISQQVTVAYQAIETYKKTKRLPPS